MDRKKPRHSVKLSAGNLLKKDNTRILGYYWTRLRTGRAFSHPLRAHKRRQDQTLARIVTEMAADVVRFGHIRLKVVA